MNIPASRWQELALATALQTLRSFDTVFQRGEYDVPVTVQVAGREWAGDDESGEWVPGVGEITVSRDVPVMLEFGIPHPEKVEFARGEVIDPSEGELQMCRDLAATKLRSLMQPEYDAESETDWQKHESVVVPGEFEAFEYDQRPAA